MTSRRSFVRTGLAVSLLGMLPEALGMLEPARWVRLPGREGDFEVRLPATYGVRARAQGYAYHQLQQAQYYAALYQQQTMQMLALQQAMQAWAAQQAWNQRMAQYRWAADQHRRAMYEYMQMHAAYQYAQEPQAWSHVRSVYAVAMNEQERPVMFGANRQGQGVAIGSQCVQGASKVFDLLNNSIGRKSAETSVGPQTSERKALLALPDGSAVKAKGYETSNGVLAISDANDFETRDGRQGAVAKYKTHNGEEYLIV